MRRFPAATRATVARAATTEVMTEAALELVANRFRTLGEPYRLRLLQVLESGERSVGELVAALDGNQPNVSRHLQILFEAGLLVRRREGTSILYAIGDPVVFQLCRLVCRSEAKKSRRTVKALVPAARKSRT